MQWSLASSDTKSDHLMKNHWRFSALLLSKRFHFRTIKHGREGKLYIWKSFEQPLTISSNAFIIVFADYCRRHFTVWTIGIVSRNETNFCDNTHSYFCSIIDFQFVLTFQFPWVYPWGVGTSGSTEHLFMGVWSMLVPNQRSFRILIIHFSLRILLKLSSLNWDLNESNSNMPFKFSYQGPLLLTRMVK